MSDAEKAQRDLIKERIEAYKELQSQYEKYLKMYDKETAKTKALESLKYKLQNAGIYGDAVGIFPDEKTIAEKIKGLAAQYKDLSKRGDAYKIVADLQIITTKAAEILYHKGFNSSGFDFFKQGGKTGTVEIRTRIAVVIKVPDISQPFLSGIFFEIFFLILDGV